MRKGKEETWVRTQRGRAIAVGRGELSESFRPDVMDTFQHRWLKITGLTCCDDIRGQCQFHVWASFSTEQRGNSVWQSHFQLSGSVLPDTMDTYMLWWHETALKKFIIHDHQIYLTSKPKGTVKYWRLLWTLWRVSHLIFSSVQSVILQIFALSGQGFEPATFGVLVIV